MIRKLELALTPEQAAEDGADVLDLCQRLSMHYTLPAMGTRGK